MSDTPAASAALARWLIRARRDTGAPMQDRQAFDDLTDAVKYAEAVARSGTLDQRPVGALYVELVDRRSGEAVWTAGDPNA